MDAIRITKPATRTVYPEIGNNLELPEDERFAIVLEIPSDARLAEASVKVEYDNNMVAHQVYSQRGATEAFVRQIKNAPELDFGDTRRKLTIQDLYRFSELTPVLRQINSAIAELRQESPNLKN